MNNSNHVKQLNISAVLQCIRREGPISKGNIAGHLGISAVTAHKLVEELCQAGVCCESGDYISYGGKKAALYTLNEAHGLILGLSVTRKGIFARTSDLFLKTVCTEAETPDLSDAEGSLAALTALANKMIRESDRKILAIGLSVPGSITPGGDQPDLPGLPQWSSLALGQMLRAEFGLPVFADNDVNALALSVKWLGDGTAYQSFCCVQVDNGVGVGAMVGGELLQGASYHGGEFGHITLDPNGQPCSCGRRGCLQTYLDETAIFAKQSLTPDEGLKRLAAGDALLTAAFESYLCYLRLTVDNVLRVFDPEAVYLAAPVAAALPDCRARLQTPYFEIAAFGKRRPPVTLLTEPQFFEAAASAIAFDRLIHDPNQLL